MNTPSLSELINLSGKVAVVTGGAMGIGEAIVRRLHEAGANVVIGDLAQEQMDILAGELNATRANSAATWRCDVSKADDVSALLRVATDNFGGLDILVNNAGIYPMITLADMSEEQFSKVIEVNLKGVFLGTKQAAEIMKEQGRGGNIVTVCSIDSLHPSAVGLAAYDASKHGVWGFLKNAALELAELGVRVNAINADAVFGDDEVPSQLWAEVGSDRMKARGLDEDAAYHAMRKLAMERGQTMAKVARDVIDMARVLL